MISPERIEAQKAVLRREMARRCGDLPGAEPGIAGRSMAEMLAASGDWLAGSRVGLFASLPGEPDTRPLFAMLQGAGKAIFLPRCLADGRMEMAQAGRWEDLVPGRFDILEPPQHAVGCPVSSLDLLLMPGVAFDSQGGRLGRGGGFYDRALAGEQTGPRRLGVGFAFQVVERVPVADHDRRVDGLLTERGVVEAVQP
jgi:5-formyltetrahydrofolate cyclo-ligase